MDYLVEQLDLGNPSLRRISLISLLQLGVEEYVDEVVELILGEDEGDLQAIVERFRDEELEHRDIAVDHEGREARHYEVLRNVIQRGCRTAIKIAEKV